MPNKNHSILAVSYEKASRLSKRCMCLINEIDSLIILSFVIELYTLLPYNRRKQRWSCGKLVTSDLTMLDTLFRRCWRWRVKRGQERKKCSEVSSARPQAQRGLLQLKLWLERWSLRSENVTLTWVRSLKPVLSCIEERVAFRTNKGDEIRRRGNSAI